jgi:hypothetical protein
MWTNFQHRHESSTSAFEALCCQLFERWCRKEYADSLQSFYFVDGRGGDGGVEAFATLDDGTVVGLQAKAFWNGFKDPQKKQIQKSISSASKRHPQLKRYIVCCPLDLLDSKGSKKENTTQRERWDAFATETKKKYPNLLLEYRGEAQIRAWLQSPDSETVRTYWFDKDVIPNDHWRIQFERTKSAWLNLRYVPNLHISTILDKHLSWYVNSSDSVNKLLLKIARLSKSLSEKSLLINDIKNLPGDHSHSNLSNSAIIVEKINTALDLLSLLGATAKSQYLPAINSTFVVEPQLQKAIYNLVEDLGANKPMFTSLATDPAAKASSTLMVDFNAVSDVLLVQQRLSRMHVVTGEAGTGKTQTITKLCDSASASNIPVIVIPARAYDPVNSWNEILSQSCNRPSWNADEILDALEASTL